MRPQRSLVRAEAAATSAAARSPGAPARRPWRRHPRKPGSRDHPAPGAQWAEHPGGQVTRGRGLVAPEPGKEVERERRAERGAEGLKHPREDPQTPEGARDRLGSRRGPTVGPSGDRGGEGRPAKAMGRNSL